MRASFWPAGGGSLRRMAGVPRGRSGGDWWRRTRFVRFAPSGSAQISGELGEEAGRGHAEGHVPMPSVPGACLAMIEAEIALGALETFLDGPPETGSTCQLGKHRALGREGEVVVRSNVAVCAAHDAIFLLEPADPR